MTLILLALIACRPDIGDPVYPDPVGDTGSEYVPGPDPYVDGEDRLSLGFFYEGPYSEFDPPDNLDIWESTFSPTTSAEERVEGEISDVWVHSGAQGWWGGGIRYDAARDLSSWATLNLDLMSPTEGGIPSVDIVVEGGAQGRLDTATYGFAADGEWHHLVIPLADFSGVGADLGQVTIPLALVDEGGVSGDQLFIDNLFLE